MSAADLTSSNNMLVATGTLNAAKSLTTIQLDSGQIVSILTRLLVNENTGASHTFSHPSGGLTIAVLTEDIPLLRERWDITRVACDAEGSERFGPRQEGEVTIFPIFEERAVSRTCVYLIEEVRVVKTREVVHQRVEETLARGVISIERIQS